MGSVRKMAEQLDSGALVVVVDSDVGGHNDITIREGNCVGLWVRRPGGGRLDRIKDLEEGLEGGGEFRCRCCSFVLVPVLRCCD
jgi:hypothetical protein